MAIPLSAPIPSGSLIPATNVDTNDPTGPLGRKASSNDVMLRAVCVSNIGRSLMFVTVCVTPLDTDSFVP